MSPDPYLFRSARLGFRAWRSADIAPMAAINADPLVMQYFPATQTEQETAAFVQRMQQLQAEKGFCYFALDLLETGQLIGFTGLALKDFEADFTPCTDIGWRLARVAWRKGLATEAAQRCLDYAWTLRGIDSVYALAPKVNKASVAVMQKAGMLYQRDFVHPLLREDSWLQPCVLYKALRPA